MVSQSPDPNYGTSLNGSTAVLHPLIGMSSHGNNILFELNSHRILIVLVHSTFLLKLERNSCKTWYYVVMPSDSHTFLKSKLILAEI